MKQEAYTTRQRAAELLKQTIDIWRQGDHIDQLEGLENDPVFGILMTALAYQANETDSEIERFKQDVLDEYARLLTPYEAGHPIPATAAVEVGLQDDVPELTLNENSTFTLAGAGYPFMPLLQTRLINAKIGAVVRLDGRRWKVSIDFHEPIQDLAGWTFAIKDAVFRDLNVSFNGHRLPLIKPWHYADMPMQKCFSVGSLLYNKAQMYQAAMAGMDIYARQNVALFCISADSDRPLFPMELSKVDLVFDFTGIADSFAFDKSHLALNAVLLVNARINSVTLSSDRPLARIAGYSEAQAAKSSADQLMYLLPPEHEQLFGKTPVSVRRIAADRFNQAAMMRLVNSLTTKFQSDYYAFLNLDNNSTKHALNAVQDGLTRLTEALDKDVNHNIGGVYLMLDRAVIKSSTPVSLEIRYLTTQGSAVNTSLISAPTFTPPPGLDSQTLQLIAPPMLGSDEVNNAESIKNNIRYYLVTNDRIVTPADMKIFCITELVNRYSLAPEFIRSIQIRHRQMQDASGCGYCMDVNIQIEAQPFVIRNFEDKIPQVEMLLQTMMEVRSTQLYPIFVTITLTDTTK